MNLKGIKVKIKQIVNPDFSQAYVKLMKLQVPMKTAYKLKKIAELITDEQKKYEELRKELLTKLGEKNEDGSLKIDQGIVSLGENQQAYYEQHLELLDIDVEMGVIKIDDLGDAQLSAAELSSLGELIGD